MNDNEKYLIECLKAYLNKEKLSNNNNTDINYSNLYSLSRSHNLSATMFSVIRDIQEAAEQKEAYKAFEDDFYDAIVRYDCQNAIQQELINILSDAKIKHTFFKGAQIKEYFPAPELRSMGDIDLLISIEERDKVKKFLVSNDFELISHNGPVYNYQKNGVLVEVHTKIVSGKVGSKQAEEFYESAIDHSIYNGYTGTLEPNYHFEYLITHIAHHFWFYGAGVKMIMDLAIMQQHFDINLDKVLDELSKIQLDFFAKIIISICYKWFGIGTDYGESTEKTEEFLLNFGAFGNLNRNKSAVIRRKAIEEGKTTAISAKIGLLFPSYEKMKNIPYMTFMEGKPYLLPAGWVYRGYYNLKNKKDFIKEATANLDSDETKKEAEEELKYFEEIGLI